MDVLVIGAGVVGLAIARALAMRGHGVIVAEKTGGIGNGVSSRNSEVIHGGMYYPTGSGRARHCVAGRRMLYAFCESHGVPHRKCGKLIVATNDLEQAKIEGIYQQGLSNDVEGLAMVGGAQARALEPNLNCDRRDPVLGDGIVDSHSFMLALQGDPEDHGGAIAFHAVVDAARTRPARAGTCISSGSGSGADPRRCGRQFGKSRRAGLARATEGYPAERVPPGSGPRQLFRLPRQVRPSRT